MNRIVSSSLRILLAVLGVFVFSFGGVGVLVGIIAIVDPEGTQHANDSDPFGTPPPLSKSLALTEVFLAVAALGVYAVYLGVRGTKDNSAS